MSECYELTLTQNYVSDWTFCDAIRELIQNGTDQEILDNSNDFSINYDYKNEILRFTNSKSKLSINTLLLGKSSKSDNDDTVGQFGEGYKIAALVLNRLGKTFTVYNNEKNEVWKSSFKNSEKWREKILSFYIEKSPTKDKGLVIEIGNVSSRENNDLYDVWLGFYDFDESERIETTYGDILLSEDFKDRIFVNGLSINCTEEMKYGYNFKPKYIKLERDRKTCDSWQARDTTSLMIAEAMVRGKMEIETVKRMVESNVNDVYNMDFNGYENNVVEVKNMLISEFDKQNPTLYSIPVQSQEDINKVKAYGGNPVVVPSKVASLLKRETEKRINELVSLPVEKTLSLREKFQRWYDIYANKLDTTPKSELSGLINEIQ
ncbi:hypothetical protein [Lacrimispora sp.]|uniref:hypothetical protein n=1 Tax=Lacrimispora sp. TaxID=2719234 RepID=UPI0028B042A6|nr:hypothetical protein [Lacrimispora sp.]